MWCGGRRLHLLHLNQLGVDAALGHQLVVGTLLSHAACVDNHDTVGVVYCAESVGDNYRGATTLQLVEGGLYEQLALGVECRGGLVENQDFGVVFDKYDLFDISNKELQELRRNIGIVFQDFQLLTDRSVHDNLDFVLRCTGWKDKVAREMRIQEVLHLVDLPQKGYKRPHELSGGEQQRVVIARAILNRPALLLADEPTGNLDNATGDYIMNLLHTISREEKMAVLMITHNEQWLRDYPATIYRCADRKITKESVVR